jgi:hypothetical protein
MIRLPFAGLLANDGLPKHGHHARFGLPHPYTFAIASDATRIGAGRSRCAASSARHGDAGGKRSVAVQT